MGILDYNIALVGGGLANTATLYETLQAIDANDAAKKLNTSIRVYDIRKDFFRGGEAYAAGEPEMLFTNTFDVERI